MCHPASASATLRSIAKALIRKLCPLGTTAIKLSGSTEPIRCPLSRKSRRGVRGGCCAQARSAASHCGLKMVRVIGISCTGGRRSAVSGNVCRAEGMLSSLSTPFALSSDTFSKTPFATTLSRILPPAHEYSASGLLPEQLNPCEKAMTKNDGKVLVASTASFEDTGKTSLSTSCASEGRQLAAVLTSGNQWPRRNK